MDAFRRYYFRPRILNDVTTGSINTKFMGVESALPIFISPAAMAKLGHPLGEVNLTKGAGECSIVQGISINASCSLDEIMAARKEGQKVFFQVSTPLTRGISDHRSSLASDDSIRRSVIGANRTRSISTKIEKPRKYYWKKSQS